MWAEQERARLRARFRQVLHEGVARASAEGRWPDAIGRARRLLALAPFDAPAAELAATTLLSAGKAIEARDVLKSFGERLDSELGVPLPAELKALYARIEKRHAKPVDAGAPRPSDPATFAGREAELAQLMALWQSTRDDAGSLALIAGDNGYGKSRLVREFIGNVSSLGRARVLFGRERPPGAQLPLGVFAEALRPLVRAPGIAGASRHLLAEAARLLPELRDTFDLPAVTDVDDEAARLRFFEGVAALIDAAAYEQSVLLAIEDAHLLPPSSLDLLSYLAARLAGSAVMFMLTARLQPETSIAARLQMLAAASDTGSPPHGDRARLLSLGPLSREASLHAVERAVREFGVPERVAMRIVETAGGVPAMLNELLRRAVAGDDASGHPVPVRELVRERLARLTSAQRRFLLVLAMIGRPATRALVANSAHVSTFAADELVRTLEADGLVTSGDDRIAASDLAADTVVETAEATTRSFLAGWIADALGDDPGAFAAERARFYALAGDPDRAFDSARRAAFDALALGAWSEAIQYLHGARAFAVRPEQQEEVASFLQALGSGHRLLRAPDASAALPEHHESPRDRPGTDSAEIAVPGTVGRLFPNWRFLLGGAVATLLISILVVSPRIGAVPAGGVASTDTLVVAEDEGGTLLRLATGDLVSGFSLSDRIAPLSSVPAWADSLLRLWTNVVAAPNGQYVAASRAGELANDLFVISADRRDTIALVVGVGDARAVGWSPDSRWLLVVQSGGAGQELDSDLYAYRIVGGAVGRALDTLAQRSITEAAWSPDGSRIAWAARVGTERQSEVFVSLADGSDVENVSRHPADDFRIAWSGDGELLAFTSMRDGNAELYAVSMRETRLWRLTRDPAQDDRAAFSGSGRLVAFESTRGGVAGLYVMPALGGEPRRIGGALVLSVVGWRGGGVRYIDHVRVQVGQASGDSTPLRLAAFDQTDDPVDPTAVRWQLVDSIAASLSVPPDTAVEERILAANHSGLVRVVAGIGGWRMDTALVRVGEQPVGLLAAESVFDLNREWRAIGVPLPRVSRDGRGRALILAADRGWESGVHSRRPLPLLPGLRLSVTLDAPFGASGDAATSASIALVAPEPEDAIDPEAPQFLRYASFTWNADLERFVYAVGREVHSEPSAAATNDARATIEIAVMEDSTVGFAVGGRERWRSTLRIIDARRDSRVHVWIGGRATGDRVVVREARAELLARQRVSNP